MKRNACSVCFTNCVRLHGPEDEEEDEVVSPMCSSHGAKEEEAYPSFLKKITGTNLTSTLQIPSSFVKTHIKRPAMTVTLEGPSRGKWKVEVDGSFKNSTISLRQGWRKFVADHVLQVGDQLAFTLTAHSHFQVEVYDESGCQKVSALDATNSPATPLESPAKRGEIGTRERFQSRPVAKLSGPKQKKRSEPDKSKPPAKHLRVELPSSGSELRSIGVPGDGFLVKETARPETSLVPHTEEGGLLPEQKLINGIVISQRRPVTEAEKLQALQAALALQLENPNTLRVMTKGYVYRCFWMALNRQFAKDWMPSETKVVTLVNKAGNKWPVKWLHKEDGLQTGFSGGWRRFSLDHRLEDSDVCVFEMVDERNHVLLVHIFRVLGAPEEDVGDYCPPPVKPQKTEGRKRRKTQNPFPDGDGQGWTFFHIPRGKSNPSQSPTKKTAQWNGCFPRSKRESALFDKADDSLCDSIRQQEQENGVPSSRRKLTDCSKGKEIDRDHPRQTLVGDNPMEHACDHKLKGIKIPAEASDGAESNPKATFVKTEFVTEEDVHPSDDACIDPSHSKVSPTFSSKVGQASQIYDLMKLGRNLLVRSCRDPATPPSPSAPAEGNAGSQQTQEIIPFQVLEVFPDPAEVSTPQAILPYRVDVDPADTAEASIRVQV